MKTRLALSIFILSLVHAALPAQQREKPAYYIFSIYFGGGSWYIDAEQTQDLFEWIDGIDGIEHCDISVHGHTDNIGSIEYNQWLSQQRCRAAVLLLLEKEIEEDRISVEDFGELNPVYDNSTWEGRLKNRRVDVIIRPLII
jgi:outer membrane protein OmpA-like peptidoglycan-associated protein